MEIKEYSSDKVSEIIDLFQGSVHENTKQYYTLEQLEAWAPTPPDYHVWESYLISFKPKLVIENNKILGFLAFEPNGHVDRLYVHKDHQRQGVATFLYKHVEQSALSYGVGKLYTEASYLAKPFFKKMDFVIVNVNNICRDAIMLNNFSMEKVLVEN